MPLFPAMATRGPKLERRQVLLGHLMEIGTELFAMSATCAYAKSLGEPGAIELADQYCRTARERVRERFGRLRRSHERGMRRVSKGVMGGDYRWLESGIVPGGTEAGE